MNIIWSVKLAGISWNHHSVLNDMTLMTLHWIAGQTCEIHRQFRINLIQFLFARFGNLVAVSHNWSFFQRLLSFLNGWKIKSIFIGTHGIIGTSVVSINQHFQFWEFLLLGLLLVYFLLLGVLRRNVSLLLLRDTMIDWSIMSIVDVTSVIAVPTGVLT